jgi:hypothetical protein
MYNASQASCPSDNFLEYLGRVLPPIAPCALIAVLLVLLSSSNFWWSDSRVLSRLRRKEPSVQRIVDVKRSLFGPPVYTVVYADGSQDAFLLETDAIQRSYFFRR